MPLEGLDGCGVKIRTVRLSGTGVLAEDCSRRSPEANAGGCGIAGCDNEVLDAVLTDSNRWEVDTGNVDSDASEIGVFDEGKSSMHS